MDKLKGIIQRMIYVYRIKKLVEVILEEYDNVSSSVFDRQRNEYYSFPLVSTCISSFRKLGEKYEDRKKASKLLSMASSEGYIKIYSKPENGLPSFVYRPRVAVTGEGIKLLTPTGFANALGGAVGKISPVITVIISIFALVVSIYALSK